MIFEETKEELSSIALGRENEYRDRLAKLKYGATREILEKWIAWWNANGCVACEVAL